jgi:O-antigen ligase
MTGEVIWRGLVLLMLLAPLPFASNRAASWSALSLVVAVLVIAWSVVAVRAAKPVVWRAALWPPALLLAAVTLWAAVQALLPVAAADAGPLWALASEGLGTAVDPRLGVAPDAALRSLMRWLAYGGAFWLALQFGRDAARAWWAIRWFVIASAAYAIYGLVTYMTGNDWLLWYPRFAYFDDLTSTFVNRNSYATFAAFGLIGAVTLAGRAFGSAYRLTDRSSARSSRVADALVGAPLLYAFGAVLIAMAWLQTHSRMGFVSGVVGLIVLLLLLRQGARPWSRLLGAGMTLAAGGFLLTVSGAGTLARLAETGGFDRAEMFAMTWRGVMQAPLSGHGLGSFPALFPMFRDDGYAPGVFFTEAHNTYLELAFEVGIPAAAALTLAFLWLIALCVRGAVVRRQDHQLPAIAAAAAMTGAVHSLADFSLQMPAVALALAVILGIGVAQSWSRGRGGKTA